MRKMFIALMLLTNLRTHIRNILGNAGFMPVVIAKDITKSVIENTIYRNANFERTAGVFKLDLFKAALKDYENVEDIALGSGKHDNNFDYSAVEEGRIIFKSKFWEGLRKGNTWVLDKEDVWFSMPH